MSDNKLITRRLIQENINNGTDFEFYPSATCWVVKSYSVNIITY